MIAFCANVEEWMDKDKQNVIAIHCKGGKGRTGTMICTWLVHCGVFEEAKVSGVDPVVWGSIYHMQAPETLLISHVVKSSMGSKFQCVLIYIEGGFFSFCLAVHVQWKHLWGQYLWIVKCLKVSCNVILLVCSYVYRTLNKWVPVENVNSLEVIIHG